MEITLNRFSYDHLEFVLAPDTTDGIPPVRKIYISGENVGRLNDIRAALIAYLIARHAIGNSLTFVGLTCPPFLGVAMERDFVGSELFIGPVNNIPAAILPRETIPVASMTHEHPSNAANFRVDDLGASYRAVIGEKQPIEGLIKTNAKLAMVGQSDPIELPYWITLSLVLSDVVGVRNFMLPLLGMQAAEGKTAILNLAREGGIDVSDLR